MGLYKKKLNVNNLNDPNLIIFNIRQYLLDNNIDYKNDISYCGTEITSNGYKIEKKVINEYMKNKYNTNNDYNIDLSSNYISFEEDTLEVSSDNNYYIIGCIARSGSTTQIAQKPVKLEKEGNEIYLYDKMTFCDDEQFACFNIKKDYNYEKIFSCKDENNNSQINKKCINQDGKADTLKAANYVINNYNDKLSTFKHTFIKDEEDNYNWISTEIIN